MVGDPPRRRAAARGSSTWRFPPSTGLRTVRRTSRSPRAIPVFALVDVAARPRGHAQGRRFPPRRGRGESRRAADCLQPEPRRASAAGSRTRRIPRAARSDWVVFLLLITQLNDVAQYVFGKCFGRRRIAPRVSPGKTVEGFAGGVLASALTASWIGPLLTPMDAATSVLVGRGRWPSPDSAATWPSRRSSATLEVKDTGESAAGPRRNTRPGRQPDRDGARCSSIFVYFIYCARLTGARVPAGVVQRCREARRVTMKALRRGMGAVALAMCRRRRRRDGLQEADPRADDRKQLLHVLAEVEAAINDQNIDRMLAQMDDERDGHLAQRRGLARQGRRSRPTTAGWSAATRRS